MYDPIDCLIPESKIETRVAELAQQISSDLRGCDNALIVGVLTGAWVFMADLVRRLEFKVTCDFIRLSSYGTRRRSSENIVVESLLRADPTDQHVIIVEDIIDTGHTIAWLCNHFHDKATSVRVCTLLNKPSRRLKPVRLDYVGFEIADHFVAGYGIDYAEQYRNLPYIGIVRESNVRPS
jgi:hypoxanthine phosphoribosyltransferase